MTERYVSMNVGSSTGTDQTASSGGSVSWLDSSAARLPRFSSPTSNAFLTPAFNACAANPKSTGSPDVDPSLLRYTRSRLPLSVSSSSASNSPGPHSTARKRLHRLLYLRSSLSSLSSSSPLSPIENLPSALARSPKMYKTPVKVEVEEDVLVMDGVLVTDSESARPRSSVSEFGSTGSSSSSSSANDGGGNSLYKTEICRSWDELGFCRYGSKCQYAHGKEELRGTRSTRPKSEVGGQSGKSVPIAGSYAYRNRFRYHPSAFSSSASATTRAIAAPAAKATIMRAEVGSTAVAAPTVSPRRSLSEPSFIWPPTQEEEAYINQVLYGPSQRRRLPVFCEICPQ
ncbi:zinc finger CCCH domain-containing protein 9-like [Phoenix dactylifera]|uniref:Zinc finger CCCH domain-containing protein 9-like n=1 Tax=Phoenix dactylifera TaxID=42345 RepID=A0A8B7D209_PHODC|nr:zinc finger CCCH domain-containing protein 9-like [Phoenix dactylifera]XP_008811574.1 zinc finger CCCH domain-containing protein 9-like [Phoenix dactylifera]